jgi:hypothetical protein
VPRGQSDATTDTARIDRWWATAPRAHIGVFLAPSSLIAIDIDPRNGGTATIEQIERAHGPLVSDVTQLTGGGGEHRVFSLPDGMQAQLPGKLGPGVDVKANGYIVVEPSGHLSGGVYVWEASSDPLDGCIPSPLPDWLRSMRPAAPIPAAPVAVTPLPTHQALEVQSALWALNPDDRDNWLKVGMALHSTGAGPQAYGLWAEWARQSDKFDPRDQARVWASFSDARGLDGIKLTYVFAQAQAAGWVNPQSNAARVVAMPNEPEALKGALPLEYADELTADHLAIPQIVEDSLTAGGLSVVFGESNSGKTYMVIDLACAVARGREWLGKRTVQGAVLYVAGEGAASVRMRLLAYMRHHNISSLPVAIVPIAINLLDPKGDTHRVIEAAREAEKRLGMPVRLIVVDTLARSMGGGNENSSEDMSAVVSHADIIRQEIAAHLQFIHHSGKDSTKGARGSSVLRAAVDTEIEVIGNEIDKTHTATFTKQRDLPSKGDSVVTRFVALDFGVDQWGKPQRVCIVERVDPASIPVINLLTGHQRLFLSVARNGERYDVIRTAFYQALPPDTTQQARQKGFMRVAKWAREDRRIEVRGEILYRLDGQE